MRIGQQALANHQYSQAKELFERAYELEATFESNTLFVLALSELDMWEEALHQALLHEKQYLMNEELATFYFDLLITAKDFLYARKLIASADFPDDFEQAILLKIQQAEELVGHMKRQKIREIYQLVEKLPSEKPTTQLSYIQEIEQLPYHEFIQTAKKLIVLKTVHVLVRAKLLESLVQVKEPTPVVYLTIDEELIEVIPKKMVRPEEQTSYQQIKKMAEAYEQEDALMSKNLKEEFTMQSAIVYPIYDSYIGDLDKWFEQTVASYTNQPCEDLSSPEQQEFAEKRNKIITELLLFNT
nr:hypothetical protein [Enterococcus sp. DIV1298c]